MSTDYGSELVSILEPIELELHPVAGRENPFGLDISAAFFSLINRPEPVIIYFPPGHYFLGNPPDGSGEYRCGEDVQLFFAVNALIRLERKITLVIDGSLRAGAHQIFGRNRSQRERFRSMDDSVFRPVTWSLAADAGKVVITSDRIPFVRPEWWGALVINNNLIQNPGQTPQVADSSEALQAAFDAACSGRSGRSSLPIMLEGLYQCCRTLEARMPSAVAREYVRSDPKRPELPKQQRTEYEPAAPPTLILRGKAGVGTGGGGMATLSRTRNDELEADFERVHGAPEEHPALLRIFPGVDFDFDSVNFAVSDTPTGSPRAALPKLLRFTQVLA